MADDLDLELLGLAGPRLRVALMIGTFRRIERERESSLISPSPLVIALIEDCSDDWIEITESMAWGREALVNRLRLITCV